MTSGAIETSPQTYARIGGLLYLKSTFLPRILGVLMAIADLCYLTNSFVLFLAPGLAHRFFYILLPAGVAELSLTLWLLVKGVNVPRWMEVSEANQQRSSSRPLKER